VAETKERFRQFILNFVCEDMDGEFDPETPLYLQKLDEVGFNILPISWLKLIKMTYNKDEVLYYKMLFITDFCHRKSILQCRLLSFEVVPW